jgi:hypothetical protein
MKSIKLSWTTNGAGAATALSEESVFGTLYSVEYRPEATTNATFVLTCEADISKALLTKATAGGSAAWFYPRDLVQDNTGADLTGAAGGDRTQPVLNGYPKVVISSGGATKAGSLILYYEEQ